MFDAKLVATLVLLAAFDRVPTFNVEPACHYLADRVASSDEMKRCLRSEQAAREQLAQEWAAFALEDRAHCTELATVGDPSYADLLTCLELARETRAKRDDMATPTTGPPRLVEHKGRNPPTSGRDAVDGSSTGTRVPRKWVLLKLPRFGGASHANGHDDRSRHREVCLPGPRS